MQASLAVAQGVRLSWHGLPAHVRTAVEAILGWPVVGATTQRGGFSPGVAARLRGAAGGRAFVKAVSSEQNPDSPELHRREAGIAAMLPASAPVPGLLGTFDDGSWVALVFTDVDGRQPALPWRGHEVSMILDGIGRMHEALTPCPGDGVPDAVSELRPIMTGWERLASSPAMCRQLDGWGRRHLDRLVDLARDWPAGVTGSTLLHMDLRADNLLITGAGAGTAAETGSGAGVVVVDWPWAAQGADWVDVALMAPCVWAQGGPSPDDLLAGCRSSSAVPRDALVPFVAGVAGFFVHAALQPAPPGLPTLRPFQDMQGRAACAWLRQLTGLA